MLCVLKERECVAQDLYAHVVFMQQAKALDRLQKEMEALRKQLLRQRDGLHVSNLNA